LSVVGSIAELSRFVSFPTKQGKWINSIGIMICSGPAVVNDPKRSPF
jgi:hypothetical protein